MMPPVSDKMEGEISTLIEVQEESGGAAEVDIPRPPKSNHHKKRKCGFSIEGLLN